MPRPSSPEQGGSSFTSNIKTPEDLDRYRRGRESLVAEKIRSSLFHFVSTGPIAEALKRQGVRVMLDDQGNVTVKAPEV